jgi:hypothetical protein
MATMKADEIKPLFYQMVKVGSADGRGVVTKAVILWFLNGLQRWQRRSYRA